MDLIDFAEEYRASTDFKHLRMQPFMTYVPGRGTERPTVMVLSDAPSALDNNERKAVAGQPGRVLDQLMALAALSANPDEIPNAYITPFVKYRPGPMSLTTPETIKSLPWVMKEWKVLGEPPVIVTLGLPPMMCLLGVQKKLSEVVGKPHRLKSGGPTIWPMLHPSYPMNEPRMRPVSEAHWEALGEWLQEKGLV